METFAASWLPRYVLALSAGVLAVVATLLFVSLGPAIVLAALLVPTIGVAYVFQGRVHERVPMAALALAGVAGSVAGVGLSLVGRLYTEQVGAAQMMALAEGRLSLSLVLLLGVTMPLLADLVKLIGPLLARSRFGVRQEALDGVILGVASGVGFAATSALVNYLPLVLDGYTPTGTAAISTWTATLVGLSALRPLVHATTGGLIAAGVWATMNQRGRVMLPIAVGFGASVMYSVSDLLLLSRGGLVVLTLHGVVLAVLIMTLRFTVREAVRVVGAPARATES